LLSPFSLQSAFALLYDGVAGKARTEMTSVFGFDAAPADQDQSMGALLGQVRAAADGKDQVALTAANDVWSTPSYQPLPSYLDAVKTTYDAGIRLVDFTDPSSAKAINGQVSNETQGLIPDLVGRIDPDTVLMLTSALYLKADWQTPFPQYLTAPGDFTRADGTTVNASLMQQCGSFPYAETESYQAVSLPYDGGHLALLVVLPKAAGSFIPFVSGMNATAVESLIGSLTPATLALTLPKVEFSFEATNLMDSLKGLGLNALFAEADMSPLFGPGPAMRVNSISHKAYLKLDELGTTAAAATGIGVAGSAAPPCGASMAVVRPALIYLYDTATKALLFAGQIADPTAKD
jgi:serpin B